MELVKASAVVLALEVSLNILEQLLNSLEPGVNGSHLVLRCDVLEELRVTSITLGRLTVEILDDIVSSLVHQLHATAEVDNLRRNACVQGRAASLGRWWWILVRNRLLWRLLVVTALVLGDGLSSGRFQSKFKDLEGIRVLGSGSRDTESVSRRQRNLNTVSWRARNWMCGREALPWMLRSRPCRLL